MERTVRKVVAFVVRERPKDGEFQVLVFDHPLTDFQFPAGTMEPGETLERAARRELREETGVEIRTSAQVVGSETVRLERPEMLMLETVADEREQTDDPAVFERGHRVELVDRRSSGWQIRERVYDHTTTPKTVVSSKTGVVQSRAVTPHLERTFVHFDYDPEVTRLPDGASGDTWTHHADGHDVTVHWRTLDANLTVYGDQARWLRTYLLPLIDED